MADAVLFDLDGVLVDSYEVWFELMAAGCVHYGRPAMSRAAFADSWGQGVHEDVRLFFPDQTVDELEAYYDAHFLDHVEKMRVDPEAGAVTGALAACGVRTSLVTNTPRPLAEAILRHAGVSLDEVVGGTCVPEAKPAPDMIHLACERLGVERADAVVVGDSHYDRDAARSAGVCFIGFRIAGDLRIESLAELIEIVGSPAHGQTPPKGA